MPAILALTCAAVFGVADFLGGFATRKSPVVPVTLLSNSAGAVLAVVLWFIAGGTWSIRAVALGGIGGLAGLVGLLLLYDALASGQFQIVSPISAVTGAAVPVVAGITLGDRPELLAIIGLIVTPLAIWLLAGGERAATQNMTRRLVAQSFLAGMGFGVFFVFLDQTSNDAGAVPLVAARIASLAALVIISAIGSSARPTRETVPFALAAGVTDMAANGLFLWATREGDLSVVGALASLYPASTVLLAWLVLGERLQPLQRTGLAMALGAAALLSI